MVFVGDFVVGADALDVKDLGLGRERDARIRIANVSPEQLTLRLVAGKQSLVERVPGCRQASQYAAALALAMSVGRGPVARCLMGIGILFVFDQGKLQRLPL